MTTKASWLSRCCRRIGHSKPASVEHLVKERRRLFTINSSFALFSAFNSNVRQLQVLSCSNIPKPENGKNWALPHQLGDSEKLSSELREALTESR
jgi:hypothetical protein